MIELKNRLTDYVKKQADTQSKLQEYKMAKYAFLALASAFVCGAKAAEIDTINSVSSEQLIGRYGHYDIVAYKEKLFWPVQSRTLIISYGLTDFYLEQGKLYSKDRFCFSEHKSNLPFTSSVSDDFTQAIIPEPVALEVYQENDGVIIFRPESPTLLGVNLESYLDPFPESADDPAYVDDDIDGFPGVTVEVRFLNGLIKEQIYLARKEIFAYYMRLNDDGSITGVVFDRSQQKVIGASVDYLRGENNPPQDLDLSKSPISLIPVAETMDCEQLKQQRDNLFPPAPDPN